MYHHQQSPEYAALPIEQIAELEKSKLSEEKHFLDRLTVLESQLSNCTKSNSNIEEDLRDNKEEMKKIALNLDNMNSEVNANLTKHKNGIKDTEKQLNEMFDILKGQMAELARVSSEQSNAKVSSEELARKSLVQQGEGQSQSAEEKEAMKNELNYMKENLLSLQVEIDSFGSKINDIIDENSLKQACFDVMYWVKLKLIFLFYKDILKSIDSLNTSSENSSQVCADLKKVFV